MNYENARNPTTDPDWAAEFFEHMTYAQTAELLLEWYYGGSSNGRTEFEEWAIDRIQKRVDAHNAMMAAP